jgi:hypothetical protein
MIACVCVSNIHYIYLPESILILIVQKQTSTSTQTSIATPRRGQGGGLGNFKNVDMDCNRGQTSPFKFSKNFQFSVVDVCFQFFHKHPCNIHTFSPFSHVDLKANWKKNLDDTFLVFFVYTGCLHDCFKSSFFLQTSTKTSRPVNVLVVSWS